MEACFQTAPGCDKKKHNCPDCLMCQMCSHARCSACQSGRNRPKQLSVAEQIRRFEELNQDDLTRPDEPLRVV